MGWQTNARNGIFLELSHNPSRYVISMVARKSLSPRQTERGLDNRRLSRSGWINWEVGL